MPERTAPQCGCVTTGHIIRGMCKPHYDRWIQTTPKQDREMPPRMARKFEDYIEKRENGCWEWTGPRDRKGYGRWSDVRNGETGLAHRISLARREPPADPTLFACHHCDNPPCVNPDHLYWGTVQDNTRDVVERQGIHNKGVHRSHCSRGHVLNGDNLRIVGKNQEWKCRTCDNARAREYQRRRRASS